MTLTRAITIELLMVLFMAPIHTVAQKNSVDIRFRCLAWDQTVMEKQFVCKLGSRSVAIKDLHTLKRSSFYRIRGQSAVVFSTNGKPPFEEMAEEDKLVVVFPAQVKQALLIFVPDKNKPCGVRALVLDDSMQNFPWGSYRFVNATGEPLVCWMDKLRPKVLSRPDRPVNMKPEGARRNFPIALALKTAPKKHLFTSIWEHRPDYRRLVIITRQKDQRHGVIGVKVVPERQVEHQRREELPRHR